MTEFNHHGIEGQKWGIQNGPPYPLDKETHKQVIKDKKKEYKDAKKNAQKAIYDEAKYYEDSRFDPGKIIATRPFGEANPELQKIVEKTIKEVYDKKIDYKTVKKGQDWLNKHKNDYLMISAANVTAYYNPKSNKINYIRRYYY